MQIGFKIWFNEKTVFIWGIDCVTLCIKLMYTVCQHPVVLDGYVSNHICAVLSFVCLFLIQYCHPHKKELVSLGKLMGLERFSNISVRILAIRYSSAGISFPQF
jgi:hypothetical protein